MTSKSGFVAALAIITPLFLTGGAIVVGLSLAAVGYNNCAPAGMSDDGQVLSGESADEYLAQFSDARQAEMLAIVEAAYRAGVEREKPATQHAIVTVVATGIQETNLENMPSSRSDRDSAGFLQQRPSQGWGSEEQVMDPYFASNNFYDRYEKLPGASDMSMKQVALLIQRPSVSAYARWNWDRTAYELVDMVAQPGVSQSCSVSSDAHLPVDEDYSISSPFNDPNYIAVKPHKGTDFTMSGGSAGKPVYAARSGKVIVSGIGNSCYTNNTVMIEHGDGTRTGYLHMPGSSITVRVGDTVQAGQQIGVIGDCGDSHGAHLHFEVALGSGNEPWISGISRVEKYGVTWLDPVAYMAHFGIKIE